jgi:hypothetical protein
MKAVFIDTKNRTFKNFDLLYGEDEVEALLGGKAELACYLDNGDRVLISEDGMLRFDDFFAFEEGNSNQPYPGNGLVVGPCRDDGLYADCLYDANDLKARIEFLNRPQVIQWLNQQRHYDRVGGWMRAI